MESLAAAPKIGLCNPRCDGPHLAQLLLPRHEVAQIAQRRIQIRRLIVRGMCVFLLHTENNMKPAVPQTLSKTATRLAKGGQVVKLTAASLIN